MWVDSVDGNSLATTEGLSGSASVVGSCEADVLGRFDDGWRVGTLVGLPLGFWDSWSVGASVGRVLGLSDGCTAGLAVGPEEASKVACLLGLPEGAPVSSLGSNMEVADGLVLEPFPNSPKTVGSDVVPQ
jgi:hypothetical protein